MQTSANTRNESPLGPTHFYPFGLASGGDPDGSSRKSPAPSDQSPAEGEDLPYKVELWDLAKKSVEQVLAVTASGSIGFAAYYAATREFPDRYLTLRHKNSTVATSNGPQH